MLLLDRLNAPAPILANRRLRRASLKGSARYYRFVWLLDRHIARKNQLRIWETIVAESDMRERDWSADMADQRDWGTL